MEDVLPQYMWTRPPKRRGKECLGRSSTNVVMGTEMVGWVVTKTSVKIVRSVGQTSDLKGRTDLTQY